MAGMLVERAVAAGLQAFKSKRAHQMAAVPIYGKRGARRARRSSADMFQALQLAEDAQQSTAVLRYASGSNWLAGASARLRGSLYVEKSEAALGRAAAYSLTFDGMSISGWNLQTGLALQIESGVGAYLTPKAMFLFWKKKCRWMVCMLSLSCVFLLSKC